MNRRLWLQQQIQENDYRKGVELGVLRGPTFKHLIKECPNLELTGLDVFFPDKDWKVQNIKTNKDLLKTKPVSWYNELIEFCESHGSRAKILRSFTNQAAEKFEDNSLDFVFIDAGHGFDSVSEDIKLWEPKVNMGCLVSGHDIDMFEVRMAVSQFNMNCEVGPDNIWYWIKK